MKYFEIATGYTSIPAKIGAATEKDVEGQTKSMVKMGYDVDIVDICDKYRAKTNLPIIDVYMPQFFNSNKVVSLGFIHKLKRVLYSISLTYKLHSLIKSTADSIYLHFHNQYNMFFFMKLTPKSLLKNVTIGYTVHSYIWYGKYEDIKEIIRKRYFQEVYCCQKADTIFVLNDVVTKMLVDNYQINPKKIKKIFNGVDTDVYDENFKRLNAVRCDEDPLKRIPLLDAPDGTEITQLHVGIQIRILDEQYPWVHVSTGFEEGWLKKEYFRIVPVKDEGEEE